MATAANKELFIEQLAAGIAPGDAAEAINIDRSTAYAWKKDDGLFSARWDNAVETSLDKLETVGDINAIMNTLKYRRKHVYSNNTSDADRLSGSQTNYFLDVTLQEQLERLDRLGLPRPVIESDREEDYAPTPCLAPPAAPRRSLHHYVKLSNLTMKPRFGDCRHVGKLGQAVRSRHGECADFTALRQGDHDRRVGKSEHGLPNGDAQHHLAGALIGDRLPTFRARRWRDPPMRRHP